MAAIPMQPVRHVLIAALVCWTVTATPLTNYDGDTFDATVYVWMGFSNRPIHVPERVRLLGVDTPELKGTTKPAALAAKQFTADWLAKGPIQIEACKRDAFGRVLGKVTRDGENLAVSLIAAGHGVPR